MGTSNLTYKANATTNSYTVKYTSGNNNCTLDTTTYANKSATYATAWSIANPTCTGYTFNGWTASTLNTNTAKYGSSSADTSWTNASTKVKGTSVTYFNNLITTASGTVTLTANWTANTYTVTFAPDGGTVSPTSKSVTYNSTYGNLPTPEKTGYTFTGWNGKNLFNKDAIPYKSSYYIRGADNTEVSSSEFSIYQVSVKPSTTYTITNSGGSTAPGYVIYNSSGTKVAGANYANVNKITFTTPSTASYIRFSVVTLPTSNRYDKETFQLEEKDSATIYESYYITSSTTVTTAKAHTITARWNINNPATPTISGAGTKVRNHEAVRLTCATTATYASGTTKYYSFGYATTDGGTPNNWTTAGTSATYDVPKDEYTGTRYYSCRVYASDGTSTSSTVASATSADAAVSYVNARIDFNATENGGTISGTSPLYTAYGKTAIYTGRTNTTTGTIPTATKTGWTFNGWYTAKTEGTLVINSSKTVQASASGWTDASKNWLKTSTSDTLNTNRLYAQYTINNPATPTISGAGTKVRNHEAVRLTCATTATYASGTTKYYSFGYATTDGGTPNNWTTAGTSATYDVPKDEYTGTRYYSCRVYASDGTSTSSTVASATSADAAVSYVNARIDFNATENGGTISGTSPLYTAYGKTAIYTGRTNTTTGTIPTATKTGWTFNGWYTAKTEGTLVINSSKTVQASASGWTDASKNWLKTSTSDTLNTNRLYAQYTINNPATPTISVSGSTNRIYGAEATKLTCATTTTYASGTNKYYSFGYATTDGGTPSNWTTPGTSATLTISATENTEFVGTRYYSCKVCASEGTTCEGTSTSSTVASATTEDIEMTINNAKITFDATSGTLSGTSQLFTRKGSTDVYTYVYTDNDSTAGTIPTATKTGYKFNGWYTAQGGTKVLNADGTFAGSVGGYTSTGTSSTGTSYGYSIGDWTQRIITGLAGNTNIYESYTFNKETGKFTLNNSHQINEFSSLKQTNQTYYIGSNGCSSNCSEIYEIPIQGLTYDNENKVDFDGYKYTASTAGYSWDMTKNETLYAQFTAHKLIFHYNVTGNNTTVNTVTIAGANAGSNPGHNNCIYDSSTNSYDTTKTCYWSIDSDGTIRREVKVGNEVDQKATTDFWIKYYGDTFNLVDWNNDSYIKLSKENNAALGKHEWYKYISETKTMYDQNDRSLKPENFPTDNGCSLDTSDCIVTLYVNWVADNWKNGNYYYHTLYRAIENAESRDTIVLQHNYTDSTNATIDKDLTINTNGKTLTRKSTTTKKEGTTTIDGGEIKIKNGITTTINGSGTITTINGKTTTINGGNSTTTDDSEVNYSTLKNSGGILNIGGSTITQATTSTEPVVYNDSGTLTIDGGTVKTSANENVVKNNAITTIQSGAIINSSETAVGTDGTRATIANGSTTQTSATLDIQGGRIVAANPNPTSVTNNSIERNAINNYGTLTASGGIVAGRKAGISNIGTVSISDGSFYGGIKTFNTDNNNSRTYMDSEHGFGLNNGYHATITGGTFRAAGTGVINYDYYSTNGEGGWIKINPNSGKTITILGEYGSGIHNNGGTGIAYSDDNCTIHITGQGGGTVNITGQSGIALSSNVSNIGGYIHATSSTTGTFWANNETTQRSSGNNYVLAGYKFTINGGTLKATGGNSHNYCNSQTTNVEVGGSSTKSCTWKSS